MTDLPILPIRLKVLAFKAEAHENFILEFRPYLKYNTLLHYKDLLLNPVKGKGNSVYNQNHTKLINTKCRVTDVKAGGMGFKGLIYQVTPV
jgi:hypothetical protein